jgi:hypothetical protein
MSLWLLLQCGPSSVDHGGLADAIRLWVPGLATADDGGGQQPAAGAPWMVGLGFRCKALKYDRNIILEAYSQIAYVIIR